jgi:hypothetical protein
MKFSRFALNSPTATVEWPETARSSKSNPDDKGRASREADGACKPGLRGSLPLSDQI